LSTRSLARFTIVLLAVLALAPVARPARELDAAAVLERIQAWLDGTRDLSGRFVQELESGALGAGLVESGRLYVLRPGRMRWDYEDPERKLALVNGQRTTLYLEEDGEVMLGRLDEDGGLLPTLLAGEGQLADLFSAALVATPRKGGDGAYRIQLEPRVVTDAVEQVVLTVRGPRFAIEQAEVLDSLGNKMVYGFVDLRRNSGVAPALFEFEPPPGARVSGRH